MPEIKPVSPAADLSELRNWVARSGGALKCGHVGIHVICVTEAAYDLGFALVFNVLAESSISALREFLAWHINLEFLHPGKMRPKRSSG